MDSNPDEKQFAMAPVIISLLTASAEEVFGMVPLCRKDGYKSYSESKGISFEDAETQVLNSSRVKPDKRNAIQNAVNKYYKNMSAALEGAHEELLEREAKNHQAYVNTGTVSDELKTIYDATKAVHNELLSNVTAISKLFGYEMPALREVENATRITETISIVNGRIVADESEMDPVWDDAETKAFYEDLPGLESVPSQLFTEECQVKEVNSAQDSPAPQEQQQQQGFEMKAVSSEQRRNALNDTHATRMEDIVEKLQCCENKEVVDHVAEEFCYLNNKKNRQTLVYRIFEYGCADNGFIPYFSRLIAILSLRMKAFAELVVERVREDFMRYSKMHEQIACSVERVSNALFIGELTKFRVCPNDVTFECLAMCLEGLSGKDINYRKIEILCTLLESCGRFLYRTPQTTHRTEIFLESLWKHKKACIMDPQMETLLENAYYFCRPPETKKKPPRDPVREYIRYLIFSKLSGETYPFVARKLLKVSWATEEQYIIKTLLKYYKSVFSNSINVVKLVTSLKTKRPGFGVRFLDALMEEIISALEAPTPSANQRRIAHIKLFADLYRFSVVTTQTVFDLLYLLIIPFGRAEDPSDCFKVRLICIILETCGVFFGKGLPAKKLDRYLLHFQRYLLTRTEIPPDVIFAIDDCFDLIRPGYNRLVTNESINAEIQRMEEEGRLLPHNVVPALDETDSDLIEKSLAEVVDDDLDDDDDDDDEEVDDDEDDDVDSDDDDDDDSDSDDSDDDDDDDDDSDDSDDSDSDSDNNEDEDEEIDEITKKEQEEMERRRKEDEEFDKEFEAAVSASIKSSSKTGFKRNQLDIAVPFNASSNKNDAINYDPNTTRISLLVKRGKKQGTKEIMVDSSSTLAKVSTEALETGKREREEVKAKVQGAVINQAYDELEKDAEKEGKWHLGAHINRKIIIKKK